MRRIVTAAALTGVGVLVARAVIPKLKLHERGMAGCERMFQQMPEDLPPKRIMRGDRGDPRKHCADSGAPRGPRDGGCSGVTAPCSTLPRLQSSTKTGGRYRCGTGGRYRCGRCRRDLASSADPGRRSDEPLAHVALWSLRGAHGPSRSGRGRRLGVHPRGRMRRDLRDDGLEHGPKRPPAQPARVSLG